MNRGKLAILLMFAVAFCLGLVSVGYHRWASRGALGWWGGDMARLIADAPHVEALRIRSAGEAKPAPEKILSIGGKPYAVIQRKDVTAAIGLDHLRRGLLDDANFAWPARPDASDGHWQDALEFSDGTQRLVVVFDFAGHRVGRTDSPTTLTIDQIASGWQDFFADQFPTAAKKR